MTAFLGLKLNLTTLFDGLKRAGVQMPHLLSPQLCPSTAACPRRTLFSSATLFELRALQPFFLGGEALFLCLLVESFAVQISRARFRI